VISGGMEVIENENVTGYKSEATGSMEGWGVSAGFTLGKTGEVTAIAYCAPIGDAVEG